MNKESYPVFCIHILDRVDLLEPLKPITDFFDKRFYFFPGVKVTDNDFNTLILNNIISPYFRGGKDNKNSLKNEFGCAIAHFNLWKKIIDEKIEYALILEDGILFNKEIYNDTIEHIIESIKKKDIVFINNTFRYEVVNNKKKLNGYSTNGYFLSLSGAQKLLQKCIPLLFPIDIQIRKLCNNNNNINYALIPNIITRNVHIQHSIDTKINQNHNEYNLNDTQNINNLLERIILKSGNLFDLL